MTIPNGARCVVTGGGSGLGRAICLELADKKARIAIADIDEAAASETARMVAERGGEGVPVRCDVTELADLESCAELVLNRFGGIDVLVNNAGVACAGAVGDVSIEDWKWVVDVNQWGVVYGCHVFVPLLKKNPRGWLLNVASMAGMAAFPEMAPYNVTKAAVIALSETLSTELAPQGIAVSVACPTFFATNLLNSFRGATPRHREVAEKMFERSKTTAGDVAKDCIRSLENGTLYVITQREGRIVHHLKRLLPSGYFRLLRMRHRRMA